MTVGQQTRPRTMSLDSAAGAESLMGMRGWQQPGVSTSQLLRTLQAAKSDLERDIITRACTDLSSFNRAFEPRHQPDLSGHIVGLGKGEVAVLVRWFRGAPQAVIVCKKGNVKRKAITDALTNITTKAQSLCAL